MHIVRILAGLTHMPDTSSQDTMRTRFYRQRTMTADRYSIVLGWTPGTSNTYKSMSFFNTCRVSSTRLQTRQEPTDLCVPSESFALEHILQLHGPREQQQGLLGMGCSA